MAQTVEVPGKGLVEFPDGMTTEAMSAAIQKNFPDIQQQRRLSSEQEAKLAKPSWVDQARQDYLRAEEESKLAAPGLLNLPISALSTPLVHPKTSPEDLEFRKRHPIIGGIEQGIVSLAEGFTSPIGIATLGIGALPAQTQRATALAFAAQVSAQTPEIARQLGTEFGKPLGQRDTQKITAMITEAVGALGFVAGLTKKAIGEGVAAKLGALPDPEFQRIARSGAPATARAVEQTITETQHARPIPSDKTDVPKPGIQPEGSEVSRREDLQRPPSGAPAATGAQEAQVVPAIQTPAGRVVTGEDHVTAYETAKATGTPDTSGSKEGFVDKTSGEFITREAAAVKTGLPTQTEPGKLHSSDLPKTEPPPEPQPTPEQEAAIAKGEAFAQPPSAPVAEKPAGPKTAEDLHNAIEQAAHSVYKSLEAEGWKFDPEWGPLELVLNKHELGQWMFMGKHPHPTSPGKSLYEYKNGITRRYLRLDDEGLAYGYKGDATTETSKYPSIPLETAVESAYEPLGQMGETRHTPYNEDYIRRRNEALIKAGWGVTSATKEGTLTAIPTAKPTPIPEVKQAGAVPAAAAKPPSASPAQTPAQVLGKESKVRIEAPEGATQIRITDNSGKVSVMPIAALNKQNTFQGVDIAKVEAGIIGKDKKFQAVKGEVKVTPQMHSMGGMAPEAEIPKAPLGQLTDAVKGLADQGGKPEVSKAFDIGQRLSDLKDSASSALSGLKAVGKYLALKLEGKPVVTDWIRAIGDRHLALSESTINARKWVREATKMVPDKRLQEAISNWIDTGGDEALLRTALAETKGRYKAGYERALALTEDEKTFARNLQSYFEDRLKDAQEAGILEEGIENYIHRMFEKESPWKQGVLAELRSGIFTGQPALAKKRVFEYDFEAEKAGLYPVKSFIKRVAAYDLALNKAIADRQAVKAIMQIKMADGRPMIDAAGIGKKIEGQTGETEATIIKPTVKKTDEVNPQNHRGDYRSFDHPALRKWKWATTDDAGNPIFVQGEVLVHPDAMNKVRALFGQSAIRQHPVGRAMLGLGSTVKQTMLDLSGFHLVQITVHGWEHRTFKPVKEIDFTNPDVRGLVRGGMVVGETTGRELFEEGLMGSSLTKYIPVIGPKAVALKEWLFNEYIPRLKTATGLHALERNRAKFPKLSEEELFHMTANQMNNAFGELNYAMMGRSKTMQDAARLTLLAPDFLEARAGFAGQALTKFGAEQRAALLLGAAAMYVTARIMNKLLDDQYHLEPRNAFRVVVNGKAYGLRTVQGDVIHAATDLPQFIRSRLNPVYGRTVMELISGRDAFGRKRTVAQQAKDLAETGIPISIRGLFSGREQSLMESLFNAFGITERRESAASEIYKKAQEWREAHGVRQQAGEFIYDPQKDPFRAIRLAAEYDDVSAVKQEIQAAIKKGEKWSQIREHFKSFSERPFSGSQKNEAKFIASLSADDKAKLKDARAERKRIWEAVRAAGGNP